MKKKQQHRGEAFRRVQQYLDAHPEEFGAVNASDARQQLDAALTELDTAVRTQLAGFREVRGERRRQTALETELRDRHVTPVATFAKGRLAGEPEIAALTPSASVLKGVRLVNAARGMAEAAGQHAALFAGAAFPAEFIDELSSAADAVEAAIDARRRKRAAVVNATAGVDTALRSARSATLMIEAAVGRIVQRGTPLYEEWRSIKRVVASVTRTRPDGAAVAGSIMPAAVATPVGAGAPAKEVAA